MSKNTTVVGTKFIQTAVWNEIDRAKKELIEHYENYGTDVSKYGKTGKELHNSRLQDIANSLKAQVTLDNIERNYSLDWKKG